MAATEVEVLAQAIYDIRLLLSSYLGSDVEADTNVRAAAHLAYALHNDAMVILNGGSFDTIEAIRQVGKIDSTLAIEFNEDFGERVKAWSGGPS